MLRELWREAGEEGGERREEEGGEKGKGKEGRSKEGHMVKYFKNRSVQKGINMQA